MSEQALSYRDGRRSAADSPTSVSRGGLTELLGRSIPADDAEARNEQEARDVRVGPNRFISSAGIGSF